MLLARKRSSKARNSQNIAMTVSLSRLVLGASGQVQEIDIFEPRCHGAEVRARRGRREHPDLVQPAHQVRTDDLQLAFEGTKLLVGGDDARPDLPLERQQSLVGRSLDQHFTGGYDANSGTEFPLVIGDIGA